MEDNFYEKLKSLIFDLMQILNRLDRDGLGDELKKKGVNDSVEFAAKKELALLTLSVVDEKRELPNTCYSYLNDTLGFTYDKNEVKKMRRELKQVEDENLFPLFPFYLLTDKALEDLMKANGEVLRVSEVYVQTAAYFVAAFMQCVDNVSAQEMIAYCDVFRSLKNMIEITVNEEIEFNPMNMLSDEICDLFGAMSKLDSMIHGKRPIIANLERSTTELFEEVGIDIDFEKEDDEEDESGEESEHFSLKNNDPALQGGSLKPVWEGIESGKSAVDALDGLIGLSEVKEQVRSIMKVHQVNQKSKELGVKRPAFSKHMVFMGEAGTGKTTVARIIGGIYKDIGLLSKGHFVEASRVDLVGKYVGSTAPMVRSVFQSAMGGVLFIDEAYALTRDDVGDYGQEAVDTLVKLMEDNREDIVVIVAGYPELMHEFLDSNPGLRSRFPTVLTFEDYTYEELVKIFKYMCSENEILIDH
ncbi:MAG: AAA family ATPase, partial [Eubacterium sp.]|nr:AAA family ATPase [Eubacterium sp.]